MANKVTAWDEKGIPVPKASTMAWDEKGVPVSASSTPTAKTPLDEFYTKHPSSLGVRRMKETESTEKKQARRNVSDKVSTGLAAGAGLAMTALPVGAAIQAPIATGTALATSYLGAKAGGRVASDVTSMFTDDPEIRAMAKAGGSFVGGVAGGFAPGKITKWTLDVNHPFIGKLLSSVGIADSPIARAAIENKSLRPLIKSEEEWRALDQQYGIWKDEAKIQGMYSAARGKVGVNPNYLERTSKEFLKK